MQGQLNVRPFADSDAEELTDLLHRAYAELGALGLNFTAIDQSVETTRQRSRGGCCLVAERGGRLIATLTMSLPPSRGLQRLTPEAAVPARAWLNQVAVSPEARGLGIARDLWRRGRAWAIDEGATTVGVDTAQPAAHLVELYARWGFAQVDTVHWDGKTYDSVVMTRALAR